MFQKKSVAFLEKILFLHRENVTRLFMIKKLITVITAIAVSTGFSLWAEGLVSTGPAPRFVEIDVHAIAGGAGMTQNYGGKFDAIRELNNSMGSQFGVGAGAVFGFNALVGLGTELNLTFNRTKLNMMVESETNNSVSNVYLRNNYTYINIPIYVQFRFRLSANVRWNVDGGIYYGYGISGKQKQTIYNAKLNQLDQLVPQIVESKPKFFHSGSTFINSFNRGDYGIHIATGLQFGRHITVGARFNLGLKNISYTSGLQNPNIHNYSVAAKVGYIF